VSSAHAIWFGLAALTAGACDVVVDEPPGSEASALTSAPPAYGVTLVYFVPRDVPVRSDYQTAIINGAFATQAYFRSQLGNRTFTFAPTVTVCRGDKDQWQYSQNARAQIEQEVIARCGVSLDFGFASTRFLIYADVYQQCGAIGGIGNASGNLAIMPRQDLQGLLHGLGNLQTYHPSIDDCGNTYFWNANRWIYGTAHELAHTMGIPHPPGCDNGACVGNTGGSVMWTGVYAGVNYWGPGQPWLLGQDVITLLNGPFVGTVP
jgi:hypothetical protein